MNEQLEKINKQAEVLIGEIEKYKTASRVNEASAEGFKKVADAIKNTADKIRPLTGLGFLRLQYVSIALGLTNLLLIGAVIYLLLQK